MGVYFYTVTAIDDHLWDNPLIHRKFVQRTLLRRA